jgi:hypothetical protein
MGNMKNAVFWDVAPCRSCVNRRFGGTYSSLQPPAHAISSDADFSTLKMEAIRSSKTSVQTRPTGGHIPEDDILHSHRSENVKSYINGKYFMELCKKMVAAPVLNSQGAVFKFKPGDRLL